MLSMTSNKYKLQAILELREKAKQDSARLMAARRAALEEAEEELARREEMLAQCRVQQAVAQAKMMEEAGGGTEARHIVAHRVHLADLRRNEQQLIEEVREQKSAVSRAEKELEKALAALIEASQELRVIEKHRDGWQQRLGCAKTRREQKLNDEIGMIRHKTH